MTQDLTLTPAEAIILRYLSTGWRWAVGRATSKEWLYNSQAPSFATDATRIGAEGRRLVALGLVKYGFEATADYLEERYYRVISQAGKDALKEYEG